MSNKESEDAMGISISQVDSGYGVKEASKKAIEAMIEDIKKARAEQSKIQEAQRELRRSSDFSNDEERRAWNKIKNNPKTIIHPAGTTPEEIAEDIKKELNLE